MVGEKGMGRRVKRGSSEREGVKRVKCVKTCRRAEEKMRRVKKVGGTRERRKKRLRENRRERSKVECEE